VQRGPCGPTCGLHVVSTIAVGRILVTVHAANTTLVSGILEAPQLKGDSLSVLHRDNTVRASVNLQKQLRGLRPKHVLSDMLSPT
jgi:hypothetical protein